MLTDEERKVGFLKELEQLEQKYECKVFMGCGCCHGGFYLWCDDEYYPGEGEQFYPNKNDYEKYCFLPS